MWQEELRHQYTPKLIILPNSSSNSILILVHFIAKSPAKVSSRQSYKGKTILWIIISNEKLSKSCIINWTAIKSNMIEAQHVFLCIARFSLSKINCHCLCKKSPHFIDQQVITFHTFWDLISLHQKNALKCILPYFSKLKFHWMRCTFPVRFHPVFILFRWNLARVLPDNVAKKQCWGIFSFCLLRK